MPMDILLLSVDYSTDRYRAGENLGIKYIASVLQSNEYPVEVFDLSLDKMSINDICEKVNRRQFDLVGIGVSFTAAVNRAIDIVKEIKGMCDIRHLTLGGQGISFIWSEIMVIEKEIDSCVVFEGEYTTLELVRALEYGGSFKNIRGLFIRDGERVIFTGYREPIDDLDELPFPVRKAHSAVLSDPHFLLLTSRGCSKSCTFCVSGNYGNKYHKRSKWRYRSPENVITEIRDLVNGYDARAFSFIDDAFLGGNLVVGKDRAKRLARILKSELPNVKWSMECRADEVDRYLFSELRDGGLRHVFVGIDSGNISDLRLYGKQTSLKQIELAIQVINELELSSEYGFIMFHPTTTIENLFHNLEFLKNQKIASAAMLTNKLELYPGSGLLKKYSQQGLIKRKRYMFTYTFSDNFISLIYEIASSSLSQFRSIEIELARAIFKSQTSSSPSTHFYIHKLSDLQQEICSTELGVFEHLLKSVRAEINRIEPRREFAIKLREDCNQHTKKIVSSFFLDLKKIQIDKSE